MTATRRAFDLFERAISIDPASRDAFLQEHCAGDSELRAEIDTLLAADESAADFLAAPIPFEDDRCGEEVGLYRLIEHVGSGGMGRVYRAERADGAYAKPVAIKLLLIDAHDLRTRFALEQKILGQFTHPNIANLLDAGVDSRGTPYLVMEFVDGTSITEYVRGHDLDLRARLILFLKILDAIQTAHSHLIVHRDIKPSNVLVDARGEPKVLDFGIAKLLTGDATDTTRTRLGPLTPDYASPEQVRGEPIGTGSDIYSLGVLLYEIATGVRPYRIEDTRPSAIERLVCETVPQRPSAHLSSTKAGNLRDLDAIILKALEKSPRRRYASCAAFADDIRRWLDGEEVLAREPAWPERSLRFVRRHRLAASVIAAASITLLAGSAVALWQAHVAGVARVRAERVSEFLTDMLSAANPADLGRNATVSDVLDRARRLAARDLTDDPETAAATEMTLVKTYASLGDWNSARGCAETALSIARKAGDMDSIIDAEIALGEILDYIGNVDDAQAMLESGRKDALAKGNARQRAGAAHILGRLENRKEHKDIARAWFEQALKEVPDDDPESRSFMLNDLASMKQQLGDAEGGLPLLRESVDLMRRTYPRGHPSVGIALSALAGGYAKAGQLDLAARTYAETVAMQIDLLGAYHPNVVMTLSAISALDLKQENVDAAVTDGAHAAEAADHLPATSQAYAAGAYSAYGAALVRANRGAEAIPVLEKALAIYREKLAPDHALIAIGESVMGLARAQTGDVAGGGSLAASAYDRLRAKLGENAEPVILARQRLDRIQALQPRSAAAVPR
ncbi:MAG TPA: protein kinase [Rhodanobacteraceae bacterium]|nr:protein kinase [Rhodanobacteraceae bacterium]